RSRSALSLASALWARTPDTFFAPLPLRRRCGCRGDAVRRLLDDLQPQLACLPPQGLDLLLLHLGLVLLLTLAHVRHAVLERQIDDPRQLVRRRGHGRLSPQPRFHPPQEPAQGPPGCGAGSGPPTAAPAPHGSPPGASGWTC